MKRTITIINNHNFYFNTNTLKYHFQRKMGFPRSYRELCTPAFIYLAVALFCFLVSIVQNINSTHTYTIGNYTTSTSSLLFIFIVKFIYILFWTWILNLICKDGHKEIAWLLVFLPFILLFILFFTVMYREGMSTTGTMKQTLKNKMSST